jgi:hypothetical protein
MKQRMKEPYEEHTSENDAGRCYCPFRFRPRFRDHALVNLGGPHLASQFSESEPLADDLGNG